MSVVVLLATAVAMIVASVAGTSLGVLARTVPSLTQPGRRASPAVRAGFVLAPALLALLVLVAILLPDPFAGCHCTVHGSHHPHLCLDHPSLARPLVAPALALVGLWMGMAIWRVGRVAREIVRGERWARRLRRLPIERLDGVAVRVVDHLALGAFTVGVIQPIVVVDRSLWRQLSPVERRAVVHHESAHVGRGDALTLALLRVASALTLWPSGEPWIRAWKLATEAVCDRHAAFALGDPGSVAGALVSVERLRAAERPARRFAPALGIAAGTDLEGRVRALLDSEWPVRTTSLANDLLGVGIAIFALTVLVLAWPGSSLHHAVESFLGLVVH